MENKIKKALRSYEEESGSDIEYPLDDSETIEQIVTHIEQQFDLPFGVYIRGSSDGMDYWLQAEYYSKKLKVGVIWDYDFSGSFESEADLIETLTMMANEIIKFEKRITLKK